MASPGLHENSMHHDRAQRARMPSGIAATCVSGGPTAVAAGMLSVNSPAGNGLSPHEISTRARQKRPPRDPRLYRAGVTDRRRISVRLDHGAAYVEERKDDHKHGSSACGTGRVDRTPCEGTYPGGDRRHHTV